MFPLFPTFLLYNTRTHSRIIVLKQKSLHVIPLNKKFTWILHLNSLASKAAIYTYMLKSNRSLVLECTILFHAKDTFVTVLSSTRNACPPHSAEIVLILKAQKSPLLQRLPVP